jgi:acetolactate decarboxylase
VPGLDPHLAAALVVDVQARGGELLHAHAHAAVQASTLTALMDGAYDGDLTIGELLEAGDHGLGTLNGLDGELVVLDGRAWSVAADGSVRAVDPGERTPFAVVVPYAPDAEHTWAGPLEHAGLLARLEEQRPPGSGCDAVRIDGTFTRVHARSVPRQRPPYRPLAEVAADMVEFELRDVVGTVVGFRFPAVVDGIELVGHHLHFLSEDRSCGGHVLGCDLAGGHVGIERIDALHLELPAGVALPAAGTAAERAARGRALRGIESE